MANNKKGKVRRSKQVQERVEDKTVLSNSLPFQTEAKPSGVTPNIPSVPLGTLINNNYRIQELIATGGMGEVFSGVNVHTEDPVAIKIILHSLSQDKKVVTLFKREARILCQLSDEAIVRYHNFIRDPELNRFCLIMEFINGIALSDYIKQFGPLPLAAARSLLLRLSAGLNKAHKRDVIHRDLSPDNVMLRNGDVEQAVLIDFGIAKSSEISDGTLHGQLAGKFKFISPEQLGHFDGTVGPRADVYGLGLMIAAAVCGKALEMGNTVVEAVNARRTIPDLSCVPEELRPILAHMLDPDPSKRPACMLDVAKMVHNPSLIPAQYNGGTGMNLSTEADRTIIATTLSGGTVTGLQSPPQTGLPLYLPPKAFEDTSESPFGGGSTFPFSTGTGETIPSEYTPETASGYHKGLWVGAILLATITTVAGWFVLQQKEPALPEVSPNLSASHNMPSNEPAKPSLLPLDKTTREGFLAVYHSGQCSFVTRVSAGINAGKLVGYATEPGRFTMLPAAYSRAFGAQPEVVERIISPDQCPALDLLRGLQGHREIAPVLTLDTDILNSGGTIVGRITQTRGRPLWLFMVSAKGGIYDLSPHLKAQADGSFLFSFGLALTKDSEPKPQLIIAIASETPLVSAAAATAGAKASSLLPLIMAEITGRNGKAAAGTAYFILKQ